MQKMNFNIIIGCFIIAIGIITHGYVTRPSIDEKLDQTLNQTEDKVVLNLNEVAEYLNLTESEVKGIIYAEKGRLDDFGSFYGVMFPYYKVDNKYYFYKERVNEWLNDVTIDKREYNTYNYTMIK